MFRVILLVGLVFSMYVFGAPVKKESANNDENCNKDEEGPSAGDIVDERQNGTENYRINVDGLILVYAPASSVLAASSLLNAANLETELTEFHLKTDQFDENLQKSEENFADSDEEDEEQNGNPFKFKRPKLQLPAFILPLVRKKLGQGH